MPIVEYTPDRFERLKDAVAHLEGGAELLHRPFIDYYYTKSAYCRLFLFESPDGTVEGMIGVELLSMQAGSEEKTLGLGSNFFSIRQGAGGFLFRKWLTFAPEAMEFGGTDLAHRLIRARKWKYYQGINTYILNNPYQARPREAWWRKGAKFLVRNLPGTNRPIARYKGRIPREISSRISVHEETDYTQDLLPRRSPFSFRFAPTVEHLAWRYNTRLSFVHYRLFRIVADRRSAGYVILKDSPHEIVVSQCDGEDPEVLAHGVLLSLLEVAMSDNRPRTVLLTSSQPLMQRVYVSFGFRAARENRPFALGAWSKPVDVPPDTSQWLINLDWGDNGLRVPFADQETSGSVSSRSKPGQDKP
jgi:hypothetical protein